MTKKDLVNELEGINDFALLEKKIIEYSKEENTQTIKQVLNKYMNKVKKYNDEYNRILNMKKFEREMASDYDYIIGIDEVGRGPLAGPVVACATIMKNDSMIIDVKDSKMLSEKKREEIFEQIKNDTISYGIGMMPACDIDKYNILEATFLAMKKAYDELNIPNEKKALVLIDGNLTNPHIKCDQKSIIKGDAKCYCIASASILAKVTRDRMMNDLNELYPDYDFISNKGYGTEKHINALKKYGEIENIHRKSFIKNILNDNL